MEPKPEWQQAFPEQTALQKHVDEWRVSESVPDGVAGILRVARDLLVQSYYVYEFSLVGVVWSLFALETSLRGCLYADESIQLASLIEQARKRGLINEEEAQTLHKVRELRNLIAHGRLGSPTYLPEDALTFLRSIHDAVSDIYDRATEARRI